MKESQAVAVHETVRVPVRLIRPNPFNPNVMDSSTFNTLVDKVVEVGFHGAVQLRRLADAEKLPDEPYEYEMVGGEHRWKAAQVLGMEEIPANVFEGWDRDRAEAEGIAMNIVNGKIDPLRFTDVYNRLSATYGEAMVKQMMGFASESQFRSMYREVRKVLPPDMQKSLDKVKGDARTIDELSVILHELMAKHGRSMDRSYLFFQYGGKTHLLVEMDTKVRRVMDQLTQRADADKVDLNSLLGDVLTRGSA